MVRLDCIHNDRILAILLGNLRAKLHMAAFLLEVNSLADIMQKTCPLRKLLIQAQLRRHDAGKRSDFHRMLKNILTIAVPVAQRTDKTRQLPVHPVDSQLEDRLIADLHNGLIQLLGYLIYYFFNAARLNTAILHQDFQRLPRNLTAYRVEARNGDRIRRIVNDQVNARRLLDRLDVAALTADDASLHIFIGKRHN